MQLNVPIYKTEAGVHTQVPPVQSFDTLVTVSGRQIAKPGIEVLIKWNGGTSQWEEQSSYSAGVKVATKTVNPDTTATAYLYIPIHDYLAVYQCCNSFAGMNPPPGAGGSSGTAGGRVQWNTGVIKAGEEINPELLTVELDDMVAAAPFAVYITNGIQVDWGDGNVRAYTDGDLVLRAFADGYDGNVLIYHTGTIENLTLQDDAGGFRGIMTSITGSLPTGIKTLQLANNLPNAGIPGFDYSQVKVINLSNTALDATKLNAILDLLIAAGLSGGSLSMLTNPRADADLTKINTLKSRGWFVQAYGVYPNL